VYPDSLQFRTSGRSVGNHVHVTAFRYVPVVTLALALFVGLFAAAAAAFPALRRRDAAAALLNAA
jgi:hypothetical protein